MIDNKNYYEIFLRILSISYHIWHDKKNNKLVETKKYKINYLIFKEKIALPGETIWGKFGQLWIDYLESKIEEKRYNIDEINPEIRNNEVEIKFINSLNWFIYIG